MAEAGLDARPTRLSRSSYAKLGRLLALYIAQGMPFGFATLFIPLQLASRSDFSYAKTTLFYVANFPWLLKMLWAPAADTHYSARLGRRKSWILPAQFLMAATAASAAMLDFQSDLAPLFIATALLNLWASVQDTAVDGLAVEMLLPHERGIGNGVQVAGYKIGMVLGGSGLIVVASAYGTAAALRALSLGIFVLILVPLLYREPPLPVTKASKNAAARNALRRLWTELRSKPGWLSTLAFIATVKVSESMISGLLKPWLRHEGGFSDTQAAWAVGFLGMIASLAGSGVGGYLAGRLGRLRALRHFALLQGVVLVLFGAAVHQGLSGDGLVVGIVVEHFFAGLLTPALFAYMMDLTDPTIGATHYTFLATIEVASKGIAGAAAGLLVGPVGGVPTFMLVVGILGLLPLQLLPLIRRTSREVAVVAA